MKLTRQGVRDLDGPGMNGHQPNRRILRGPPPRFHEWEHDPTCSTCDYEYDAAGRGFAVHYERCRRCGATRRER